MRRRQSHAMPHHHHQQRHAPAHIAITITPPAHAMTPAHAHAHAHAHAMTITVAPNVIDAMNTSTMRMISAMNIEPPMTMQHIDESSDDDEPEMMPTMHPMWVAYTSPMILNQPIPAMHPAPPSRHGTTWFGPGRRWWRQHIPNPASCARRRMFACRADAAWGVSNVH